MLLLVTMTGHLGISGLRIEESRPLNNAVTDKSSHTQDGNRESWQPYRGRSLESQWTHITDRAKAPLRGRFCDSNNGFSFQLF